MSCKWTYSNYFTSLFKTNQLGANKKGANILKDLYVSWRKKILNSTLFCMHQNFCYLKALENKTAEENISFLFDFFSSSMQEVLNWIRSPFFQKKLCSIYLDEVLIWYTSKYLYNSQYFSITSELSQNMVEENSHFKFKDCILCFSWSYANLKSQLTF